MKRGRISYRDTLLANKRASDLYADLAGKPRMPVTDHLGNELIKPLRVKTPRQPTGNVTEKDVLAEVLNALRSHPRVAGVWRIAAGTFKDGDRYIRAAPKGFPDVLFQTVTGGIGFCEVKSPTGQLRPEQREFLDTAKANRAIAFVARCAADVTAALA